jgi:hypothetical protein
MKAGYSENLTETINGNSELLTAKAAGTYSYHSALKG